MSFICILTSVISASYYLRFVILLLRKSEKKSVSIYNPNYNLNNKTLKTLSSYSSFSMDINPLMSMLLINKLSGLPIETNLDKTNKNIIWPYDLLSSKSEDKNFNNEAPKARILTNLHSFLISILTLLILLFILKPTLILNSTQILALSLFNN